MARERYGSQSSAPWISLSPPAAACRVRTLKELSRGVAPCQGERRSTLIAADQTQIDASGGPWRTEAQPYSPEDLVSLELPRAGFGAPRLSAIPHENLVLGRAPPCARCMEAQPYTPNEFALLEGSRGGSLVRGGVQRTERSVCDLRRAIIKDLAPE